METEKMYSEKFNRVKSVMLKQKPDRVPVVPNMETYVYRYANVNLKEALTNDVNLAVNAFKKTTTDIYVDAILGNSNIIPFKVMDLFGEGIYTITEKGLQIKGSHGMVLKPEDYPEFNKNVEHFLTNEIIRRKYPILNQSFEKNKSLMIHAIERMKDFGAYNAEMNQRIKEEVGLPLLTKGSCYVAPDIMLDYLRDFVGVSKDLRRHPDEFLSACTGIHKYVQELLYESYPIPENGFVVFSPLHLPTFLKPKDFEKFYFPFMKQYIEEVSIKRGYTILFFMENDWTPYLSILQDLPSNAKVIGLFEHGDLKTYKKYLGSKMVIMGGMPLNLLKTGTKEQCLDKAKQCLDDYAPDGNYIFSVDMVLMDTEDAKAENIIATFDYIHENGKY
ncbi:MAG: uroporphyrinogen decarboxylase family protein [Eubacterium sp.]|nr:uroporphyrinogen decarboxylase family protein [Eubacterium sp.]